MNGISAMMTFADNHDAYEAYGFLASNTYSKRHDLIFGQQPRNSIQPRLADGTLLIRNQMTIGRSAADVLHGDSSSQLLHGMDGNDTIDGLGGIDLLYGGKGDDILHGGDGDDYLFGNEGDDQLFGGRGKDVLRGGVGDDTLNGGDSDDILYYQGDDTIVGGPGFDTLKLQDWRSASIDFPSTKIAGIESIDLRNQPNLEVAVVDRLTIGIDQHVEVLPPELFIRGDASDIITIEGQITRGTNVRVGDEDFARYFRGASTIFVQLGLTVNGTTLAGNQQLNIESQLARTPLYAFGIPMLNALFSGDDFGIMKPNSDYLISCNDTTEASFSMINVLSAFRDRMESPRSFTKRLNSNWLLQGKQKLPLGHLPSIGVVEAEVDALSALTSASKSQKELS